MLLLLLLPLSVFGHGNMVWPPVWWDIGGQVLLYDDFGDNYHDDNADDHDHDDEYDQSDNGLRPWQHGLAPPAVKY